MKTEQMRASLPMRNAVRFSVAVQLPILLLSAFVTDGGNIRQHCFFAFVGFNSFLISALIFRPTRPTKFDLIAIRAGFLPTLLATFFITDYVWTARGF